MKDFFYLPSLCNFWANVTGIGYKCETKEERNYMTIRKKYQTSLKELFPGTALE